MWSTGSFIPVPVGLDVEARRSPCEPLSRMRKLLRLPRNLIQSPERIVTVCVRTTAPAAGLKVM